MHKAQCPTLVTALSINHWALTIGHWALTIGHCSVLDRRPGFRQVLSNSEVVEREIGLAKRFEQQRAVEGPRRVAALARRLDAHERERRLQSPHDRFHAASLIRGP